MIKGYIQVYTGDGKGKTTACLGLVLRASGAGFKSFIGQFMKLGYFNERNGLKRFDELVDIKQFGTGEYIFDKPSDEQIEAAKKGLETVKNAIISNKYDIIVMDEANIAVACGLFSIEYLLEVVEMKPDNVELIITGRGAHEKLIEKADLVTEMKEIKHYYQQGVIAREGIEK
jgi:cob(I)alamin adenosyltransferase